MDSARRYIAATVTDRRQRPVFIVPRFVLRVENEVKNCCRVPAGFEPLGLVRGACAAAIAAGGCRLRRELRGRTGGVHDKPSELAAPLCVRHRPAVNFAMVTFLSRAHSSSQSLVSTDTLPRTILLAAASCTLTHR